MKNKKSKKEKVEELLRKGNQCLEEDEYEEALKIADELEELGETQAFEIAGKAYELQDNLEEAAAVLKRGVEKYPKAWPNWMILGNLLSNMGENEEAEDAYKTALACPDVEKDPVVLNQAIHAFQTDRFDEAMELLSGITSDYLEVDKREVQIAVYRMKNENIEALKLAAETLTTPFDIEEHGEALGRIAASACKILLLEGEDKEKIRQLAKSALEDYGDVPWLFAVLCEIDGQYSPEAHYFRLVLKVELPETEEKEEEARDYFINYDVVADSEEEALGYVMKLEEGEFASTALDYSEKIEPRPEDAKGVYSRSEIYYVIDEE